MELLQSDLTGKIIGCAFEVHKFLGNGFQEFIYHRALECELRDIGLNYKSEIEQEIHYKKNEFLGLRRADIIVEDKVLIELKAISELNDAARSQILNYLTIYNIEVGLLINFGSKSMKFERFIRANRHRY